MKNVVLIIVGAFFIVALFMSTVVINTSVREERIAIDRLEEEIKDIKNTMLFQEIEITALTNPKFVYEYIQKNNYKPIKIKNITTLYINNRE